MSTLLSIYRSSVGKKFVVGATGLFLCTFLCVHVGGNMLLFMHDGGRAFNEFSAFMASNVLIRSLEIVLFGGFLLHIITSTVLWLKNKAARKVSYQVTKPLETSTFSSRITFLTGSIIFIFLVLHMKTFWVTSRFMGEEDMYALVTSAFSNGLYDALYLVALFLLSFHLRHGFESAFQTFGIRGQRYEGLIATVGIIFWLFIPIAFATMPIYFFLHLNS